jgi:hypothetical protein
MALVDLSALVAGQGKINNTSNQVISGRDYSRQFSRDAKATRDLQLCLMVAFGMSCSTLLESLILAQDERWRRA